jgi:hypothetical protein
MSRRHQARHDHFTHVSETDKSDVQQTLHHSSSADRSANGARSRHDDLQFAEPSSGELRSGILVQRTGPQWLGIGNPWREND